VAPSRGKFDALVGLTSVDNGAVFDAKGNMLFPISM
jgi:hypothetical protein